MARPIPLELPVTTAAWPESELLAGVSTAADPFNVEQVGLNHYK
jgi:hypothetical protein